MIRKVETDFLNNSTFAKELARAPYTFTVLTYQLAVNDMTVFIAIETN